jgi:anthranilate synthase component 2
VRVVFIENHDSFSWNVLDVLPFERHAVNVVEGNTAHTLAALEAAELLVIGPGPRDPMRTGLIEVVQAAAVRAIPTLGICLGHQAMGLAFGAQLIRSTPTHGKRALAHFRNSARFIDGAFEVMRYHSLSLTQLGSPLRVVASLDDGTVMALEHTSLPMAGLQFHPDSHGTAEGRRMVEAFVASVR